MNILQRIKAWWKKTKYDPTLIDPMSEAIFTEAGPDEGPAGKCEDCRFVIPKYYPSTGMGPDHKCFLKPRHNSEGHLPYAYCVNINSDDHCDNFQSAPHTLMPDYDSMEVKEGLRKGLIDLWAYRAEHGDKDTGLVRNKCTGLYRVVIGKESQYFDNLYELESNK